MRVSSAGRSVSVIVWFDSILATALRAGIAQAGHTCDYLQVTPLAHIMTAPEFEFWFGPGGPEIEGYHC
jgi:hypothetical protein